MMRLLVQFAYCHSRALSASYSVQYCVCNCGMAVPVFFLSQLSLTNDELVTITWEERTATEDVRIFGGARRRSPAKARDRTSLRPPASHCLISTWKPFTLMAVLSLGTIARGTMKNVHKLVMVT